GTQNHEGIVGAAEAIDYLADLDAPRTNSTTRREALANSFQLIRQHEETLCRRLLEGLMGIPQLRIWGISDFNRMNERVPTVSVTHSLKSPEQLALALGKRGLYCWSGNHYALPLTEAMGLEPGGTLRIGLLHYNTDSEVDRLLNALSEIVSVS
ncbi:MAG: aminotransferase class V-fold PLP-dependent enzyme, partial [Planctomycetaceae bacterium]|nr:aminotransferase class V-fold PLP-dependent enzyme [Planctomycetaceae bacterium]